MDRTSTMPTAMSAKALELKARSTRLWRLYEKTAQLSDIIRPQELAHVQAARGNMRGPEAPRRHV